MTYTNRIIKSLVVASVMLTSTATFELHAAQEFRQRINTVTLDVEGIRSDVEAEIEFGREVAARILGRYKRNDSEGLTRYISLVGQSLVRQASRPELEYHFALLQSDEINAYTAPGGYIFVTTGALALMEDEAELAAVLAHEIAHVTQKHIVNELNIHPAADSTEAGLAALFGGMSDPARVAFLQALDKAVELLFTEGLKKEDEFEADQIGTLLTVAAGYDATALHRYLERVKAVKGEKTAVLSHTHPSFSQRLNTLQGLLTEEKLNNSGGATVQARFTASVTQP